MRPLIAANWKMHGGPDWAGKPAEFNRLLPADQREGAEVLICPPFTLLADMVRAAEGTKIRIGGQTCHSAAKGAHTGEISAEMLALTGASYVITGHSERRAMGTRNGDVMDKARAARRAGLVPIICVGESLEVREQGDATEFVIAQITASVPRDIGEYVLAYEPIWAIGTGKIPSLQDIEDMHREIRRLVGPNIRILYGGSVKPANSGEILALDNVDGALIGGASLEMDSLAAITRSVLSGRA